LEDGRVLLDIESQAQIFPASLTKIMTALVALEELADYEETITLNSTLFHALTDASKAGFLPGEEVRGLDLLYGLMLPSGAECAVGLAEHIAGTEAEFVKKMNAKARALGLAGTRFVNATGLHDQGQYTTAYDMALLLRQALQHETFREIFTTRRHSTPPTNLHRDGITVYSTILSKLGPSPGEGYALLGGKTGFTDEAGQCLASLAEKDGALYILVTAGAPAENSTQTLHIDDARQVFGALDF
jgi:D-alanyl-D-alanine carboxypeptidase (penicillin-binding protein 5/6)